MWCPERLRIHVLTMFTDVRTFALHLFAMKRCMLALTPCLWMASEWRCARAASSFLFDALMERSRLCRSFVSSRIRASVSVWLQGYSRWGYSVEISFLTCLGISFCIFLWS